MNPLIDSLQASLAPTLGERAILKKQAIRKLFDQLDRNGGFTEVALLEIVKVNSAVVIDVR